MIFTIKILQVIVSVLMVILVIIQSKSTGLSSGIKNSLGAYRSIRGFEKIVFISTIVCGVALVINSIIIVFLS